MLLYVTTDEGKERKARPLHTIPDTLAQLYDLGMREHDRAALLLQPEGSGWTDTPDWRFDREVIRIALHWRERMHVGAGQRVVIFGPLRRLWLAADFAALGLGAVSVGLSHALSDEEIVVALNESGARLAFATDADSAARLLRLRSLAAALEAVIGPEGSPEDKALVPQARFFEFGATLDTAERASKFREDARKVGPDHPACWHYAPGAPGEPTRVVRLTHREAMARVRGHLKRMAAARGDVAYFEGEAVLLETRFAWYAFAGDGYTTMALGRPGHALEDVAGLRPARILATPAWLEQLWHQVEATPASGLETALRGVPGLGWLRAWARGRRIRRALRERVGDRLRWIEPLGALPEELRQSLARVVALVESAGPIPVPGLEGRGSGEGPERGAEARLRPEVT